MSSRPALLRAAVLAPTPPVSPARAGAADDPAGGVLPEPASLAPLGSGLPGRAGPRRRTRSSGACA